MSMPTLREWLVRLHDWTRRDRLEAELTEELRFHREHLERDGRAAGLNAEDATWNARRRLGNVTRLREEIRERWSWPWLEQLQQDIRYAVRGLRRSPGFTATVIITLALGIGANSTMFNVVDQLMFRPLEHLRDPGTVHRIYWRYVSRGTVGTSMSAPYTRYLDLQNWTSSFSQFAAFSERNLALGVGEVAQERRVGVVSASYFELFDAPPALGRYFGPHEDTTPRGADVAVLSHAFWRNEFGGRDVLGVPLQVGNVRATIIGVAPEGFAGVNDTDPPVVYIPITTFAGTSGTDDAATYFSDYGWGWVNILVRRKPGVTLDQASADATDAYRRSWMAERQAEPSMPSAEEVGVHAVVSAVRPSAGPNPDLEARTAFWVSVVAAIVLLLACANVANLILARALRRRRETAMRLALGISRRRLVMQGVTESLVLTLSGGAAALLVAQWAGAALRRTMISTGSAPIRVLDDWRTISFTLALALAAGIVIGVVPSVLSGWGDLGRLFRGGARGGSSEGARLRASLLVLQAALSIVLLAGAALFVRSLDHVKAMPMGYDVERVLLVNRVVRGTFPTEREHLATRDRLLSTAHSIPGVESAAWLSSAPFVSTSATALFVPGIDSVSRFGTFTWQATTPGYFRTMGTRIIRGRALQETDRAGAPGAVVVSASMASVLWPGDDALGKCFRMRADTAPCMTVVGIAEDMVQRDLTGTQRFHYYVSLDQNTRTWGNWMALRLRGDPAREAERIRQALQGVMPGASYLTVHPLRDIVHGQQRSWRLGATMFVAFGILALVVAAVGLYGVISYAVTQRRHELSVRIALGAPRGDILRLIIGQSVRYAIAGIGIGTLLAIAASRWVQPLLFQQSATDPAIYAGVAAAMILVSLLASASPALRAVRADPVTALREE